VRDPVLKVDQQFGIDVEVIVRGSKTIRTKDAVKGVRQTAKIRKPKPSQFLTGEGLARPSNLGFSRIFILIYECNHSFKKIEICNSVREPLDHTVPIITFLSDL